MSISKILFACLHSNPKNFTHQFVIFPLLVIQWNQIIHCTPSCTCTLGFAQHKDCTLGNNPDNFNAPLMHHLSLNSAQDTSLTVLSSPFTIPSLLMISENNLIIRNIFKLYFHRLDLEHCCVAKTRMYSTSSECFSQAGSLPENISQPGKETSTCTDFNQEENCVSRNGDPPKDMTLQIIEKPLECDQCHKCFGNMKSLRLHKRRTHVGKKLFVCGKCDKSYKSSRYLRRHEMLHEGERLLNFACNQCDKCFTWPEDLQRHKKTHLGLKPYACNLCDKSYSYSWDLKRHQRTHTGEKPYRCSQCDKCFTYSRVLLRHSRTHTGVKPYKCNQCGKCFSHSGGLKRHEKTHTGERPFKCDQCGKCYSSKYIVQAHQRSKHATVATATTS